MRARRPRIRVAPARLLSGRAVESCHLLGDSRHARAKGGRLDDADVEAESKYPRDELGADAHAHANVDPAPSHEGFLRAVPAVAAHERCPAAGPAPPPQLHRNLLL